MIETLESVLLIGKTRKKRGRRLTSIIIGIFYNKTSNLIDLFITDSWREHGPRKDSRRLWCHSFCDSHDKNTSLLKLTSIYKGRTKNSVTSSHNGLLPNLDLKYIDIKILLIERTTISKIQYWVDDFQWISSPGKYQKMVRKSSVLKSIDIPL